MAKTMQRLEPLERRPLTDRTCLVTGSSRGIGREIAFELARCGADVAVNYRSSDAKAREVTETIEENGEAAVPVQADISEPAQVERMAEEIRTELGEIDVLANNAGITIDRTFENMTYEDWQTVIDANLTDVQLHESVLRGHQDLRSRPADQHLERRRSAGQLRAGELRDLERWPLLRSLTLAPNSPVTTPRRTASRRVSRRRTCSRRCPSESRRRSGKIFRWAGSQRPRTSSG